MAISNVDLNKVSQFVAAGTKLLEHGSPDVAIDGITMSRYIADVSASVESATEQDPHQLQRLAITWLATLRSYCQVSVSSLLSADEAEFAVSVTLES